MDVELEIEKRDLVCHVISREYCDFIAENGEKKEDWYNELIMLYVEAAAGISARETAIGFVDGTGKHKPQGVMAHPPLD